MQVDDLEIETIQVHVICVYAKEKGKKVGWKLKKVYLHRLYSRVQNR